MAVIKMQKVAIISHQSKREEVLDVLHEQGVVQISEAKTPSTIDHTAVEFRQADVQFAIDTLEAAASKETLALSRKSSSADDVFKSVQQTDVRGIVAELRELEEKDTAAEREIQQAENLRSLYAPWQKVHTASLQEKTTAKTVQLLGSVPTLQLAALRSTLQKEVPKSNIHVVSDSDGLSYISAHIWTDELRRFEEVVTGFGWTTIDLPTSDEAPADLYEKASLAVKEQQKIREESAKRRQQLSIDLPDLKRVAIFLRWLDEKQEVREAMQTTSSTFTLHGWMPAKKVGPLEIALQKAAGAVAVMPIEPDDGEEPPMQIFNRNSIAPFEAVTRLYGLPSDGEMDPTTPLMPFFILYFALCLTDAGYGATLALLMGLAIWKFKLKRQDAKLIWLLFYSGIVTFFVSIPFGGWFGVTPDQAPDFLTYMNANGDRRFLGQIWDIQKDVDFFRNLALTLGVIQLLTGIALAGWWKWIHGKKLDAFLTHFSVHLLVVALILQFGLGMPGGVFLTIATGALFVWGQGSGKWWIRPLTGALGAINFLIGVMSNILSYLRILALGLATGALAFAINQIAVVISDLLPGFLGVPAFIMILLFGHLISIALNGLGSFVHSGRLQFIEFFGQFFAGGGQEFAPFRRTTN